MHFLPSVSVNARVVVSSFQLLKGKTHGLFRGWIARCVRRSPQYRPDPSQQLAGIEGFGT